MPKFIKDLTVKSLIWTTILEEYSSNHMSLSFIVEPPLYHHLEKQKEKIFFSIILCTMLNCLIV